MLRQVFFELFFRVFFVAVFRRSSGVSRKRFFCGFSARRCPKVIFLASFLMTLKGPGAHARTVLPLQRELDLEGWRGSENRRFFDVFFGVEKNVYLSVLLCFLAILGAPREPIGFQNDSKWRPKKGELALH